MSQRLEQAMSRFRRLSADGGREESARVSVATFLVAIETRMHNLKRDIGELKGQLNGLIFVVVIGAVITQLPLKVTQ